MQLDLLTCDKFPGVANPNKRELETLRISRTAWDSRLIDESIPAIAWNQLARTYPDIPDEQDWYIYLVWDERLANDTDPILRMNPTADCLNTNVLCINHLHLDQVNAKVKRIERGELHPSHPLSTLAVRRAGWNMDQESIPATKWFDYQISRPEDDQTDWIIFTSETVPTNPMPESKPLNPEHNICIKALLGRNQVADAIRLASRERRISPFHIAIKRSEWPSDRTINGSDWKPELYTNWSDDWELWVADPMAFASDHEPPLSCCIRSGMHISDVQETTNARCDELGALTLVHYHIRRDQWQSSQPSVVADQWDIGKLWQDRTLAAVDLDATDWAIYFIPVVVNVPSPEQATPAAVMQIMRSLMQADESWAWSWHCNLAMMAIDAGADRLSANHGAAEFMRQAFEVNIRTSQLYRNLITGLEVEREHRAAEALTESELPVPSQHCLTLAPWLDDNTLELGQYRGYYGHYQIDWAESLINGTVSGLGRTVTTFGASTIDGAKRHFMQAVDSYIVHCQAKAQAEEDLLGVVHD
jgi:hypothetical protein